VIEFDNPVKTSLDDLREQVLKLSGSRFPDESLIAGMAKNYSDSTSTAFAFAQTEYWCIKRKRPYFNIHPPVIKSLANTPLRIKPRTIPKSVINDLGTICVKFPKELQHKYLKNVSHFYLSCGNEVLEWESKSFKKQDAVHICYSDTVAAFNVYCPMDQDFDTCNSQERSVGAHVTQFEIEQRDFITRIALGVMLLASDPAFVEPILLRRDFGKPGDKSAMAERARRNGVIGYEIGANMEVSPHFRRPHFAIRWTGKGAEIPRLVPVKGAVIHKSQLHVPTGFEADDCINETK
jgi:hypothetical protein